MCDSCGPVRPDDGIPACDVFLASKHVAHVSPSVPARGIASLFPRMWACHEWCLFQHSFIVSVSLIFSLCLAAFI